MGRSCPTYDACFYYQARRRASRAQILVVNHALFFSDLALRRSGASILPDYDVVVLDEAHTIESVAGDHLGLGISSGAIDYTLNKLYNDRTNKGLLVHYRLGDAQQQVERCRVRAGDFFHDLDRWLDDQADPNGRVKQPEIVPNLLSPALVQLSQLVRRHGDKAERRSRNGSISPPPPIGCGPWRERSKRGSNKTCPTRCIGSSEPIRAAATSALCCAPRRSTWGPRCASICSTKCRA